MSEQNKSTKPTTRSEFNARLESLSTQNEALEARLGQSEEKCRRLEIKNTTQHALVMDLMEAIHSMASAPTDGNEPNIPEATCLLLTKSAQQVSDLTEELELMEFALKTQTQVPRSVRNNANQESQCEGEESENENEENDFVDVSLCDNEKEVLSSSSSTSSVSLRLFESTRQENIYLDEEVAHLRTKCESLEHSLKTLKRKNSEREIRSMKSLKYMRNQIDGLQEERKRRLNLQASAEEHALKLEIDLLQLKQERIRQDIFRKKQLKEQSSEDEYESDIIKGERKNQNRMNSSVRNGVNRCRALVMREHEMDYCSDPPFLVSVSEESDGSEDSDEFSLRELEIANAISSLDQ